MLEIFQKFFFRDFFQRESHKAERIEREMNGRFEANVDVIVNSFQLISTNLSVPLTFTNFESK